MNKHEKHTFFKAQEKSGLKYNIKKTVSQIFEEKGEFLKFVKKMGGFGGLCPTHQDNSLKPTQNQ